MASLPSRADSRAFPRMTVCALAAFLLFLGGVSFPLNLARNPSFEEGPQGGWGHFIPTESDGADCRMGVDGPGRSGKLAAWLDANRPARHALLQNLGAAEPGEHFRLSAWVRMDGKSVLDKKTPGILLRLNFVGSNRLSVKDSKSQPLASYAWLGGKRCLVGDLERITLPPANKPSPAEPKGQKTAPTPVKAPAKPPPPPPPAWIAPGTNWARIDLVTEAPIATHSIELGLFAWGIQGRIWVDDLSVERVPKTVPVTPLFR
ncbi:MAG: hypothetical protein J0L75_16615 [Spirochaetes bacterium]|nr:hypothetical protein [Spirochaetota bacterium]